MIAALGYSNGVFDPATPGRLCRGRERWIESFPLTQPEPMHRMVISGARFSDDSAADAVRGLPFSGLSAGEVIRAIFPTALLLAATEDGPSARVPEGALGVEHYRVRRAGGPLDRWACRWLMLCATAADIDRAIQYGATVVLRLPDLPSEPPEWLTEAVEVAAHPVDDDSPSISPIPEPLRQALYLLTGQRQDGPPGRNFQAAALPDVLQHSDEVVLVHNDKHDLCLGIYSRQPIDDVSALVELCFSREALPVPFAIPPMLARWDRALWELRQDWDEPARGAFPVPPSRGPKPSWAREVQPEE